MSSHPGIPAGFIACGDIIYWAVPGHFVPASANCGKLFFQKTAFRADTNQSGSRWLGGSFFTKSVFKEKSFFFTGEFFDRGFAFSRGGFGHGTFFEYEGDGRTAARIRRTFFMIVRRDAFFNIS